MNNTVRVDPIHPNQDIIESAAAIIRRGGLVAFPTETVYGLGANAFDDTACTKIFLAKQREQDNPLIVHISELDQLDELTYGLKNSIQEKMKRIWPGPLTLILKNRDVGNVATAGLETVAVRMPAHRVPLSLISKSGLPIAAPSANKSGRPSPVRAEEVFEDVGAKTDLILDGGPSFFGVESTVVKFETDKILILRPGAFSAEELREIFELKVEVSKGTGGQPISPGMKYRHYAPEKDLLIGTSEESIKRFCEQNNALFIGSAELAKNINSESIVLGSRKDLYEVARNLFPSFRQLDRSKYSVGVIESFEEKGIGLAIMNRIEKATGGRRV